MTAFAILPLEVTSDETSRPFPLKDSIGPQVVRGLVRRTMHGGTGWVAGLVHSTRYQPQDQSGTMNDTIAPRLRVLLRDSAGEPEDARLTGGTRSLMRRLSGLNLRVSQVSMQPLSVPDL